MSISMDGEHVICVHAAPQKVLEKSGNHRHFSGITLSVPEATKLKIAMETDPGTQLPLRNRRLELSQLPVSTQKVGWCLHLLQIFTLSLRYVNSHLIFIFLYINTTEEINAQTQG